MTGKHARHFGQDSLERTAARTVRYNVAWEGEGGYFKNGGFRFPGTARVRLGLIFLTLRVFSIEPQKYPKWPCHISDIAGDVNIYNIATLLGTLRFLISGCAPSKQPLFKCYFTD